VLRGDVQLVAALLLEVDGGGDVGELEDVHPEAVRRALGGDLGVERPGLGAHVAGLDLGEVLAEAFEQGRDARLAVVPVVHDLAFLFGLGDILAGLEVEHLGGPGGALGGGGSGAQDGRGGQQGAGLQKLTPAQAGALVIGHVGSSSSTGIERGDRCRRGIAGSLCQIAPGGPGVFAGRAGSHRYQRRKISKTFRSPPRQ
jgi:hypothetical protein